MDDDGSQDRLCPRWGRLIPRITEQISTVDGGTAGSLARPESIRAPISGNGHVR
jgi:hypothetical protein